MKIFTFLFLVLFVSCQCTNIDCEPGPPDLIIQLVESTGIDPILAGSLSLENVVLRNIQKQNFPTPRYFTGIISYSIDNLSSNYVLSVNNVILDTLKVTTIFIEGECCSSFRVDDVSIKDKSVEFRPFLKIEI